MLQEQSLNSEETDNNETEQVAVSTNVFCCMISWRNPLWLHGTRLVHHWPPVAADINVTNVKKLVPLAIFNFFAPVVFMLFQNMLQKGNEFYQNHFAIPRWRWCGIPCQMILASTKIHGFISSQSISIPIFINTFQISEMVVIMVIINI